MTIESWEGWSDLERLTGNKILYNSGVMWFIHQEGAAIREAICKIMDDRNWPYEITEEVSIGETYPMINPEGLESILVEKNAGYLHARLACQLVTEVFVKEGGDYRQNWIDPGKIDNDKLTGVKIDGSAAEYDIYVFACGPWLPMLFPESQL